MKLKQVPCSDRVGIAHDPQKICNALKKVSDNPHHLQFFSFEPVTDAPCSGRIFYTANDCRGARFPHPLSPEELAKELSKLTEESRYPSPPGPYHQYQRGWEIRRGGVNGKTAVLVWAAWVDCKVAEAA